MWDHSKQSGFLGGGPGLRRDESLWYKTLGTSLMAALCLLAHWLGQSKLLLFSLLLVCGRNQSLVGGITTVHTDSSQLNGYWLQWAQTLAHTFNMNGARLFCSFFFFPPVGSWSLLEPSGFVSFELGRKLSCLYSLEKRAVLWINYQGSFYRQFCLLVENGLWVSQKKILISYIMVFGQLILLILTHNK